MFLRNASNANVRPAASSSPTIVRRGPGWVRCAMHKPHRRFPSSGRKRLRCTASGQLTPTGGRTESWSLCPWKCSALLALKASPSVRQSASVLGQSSPQAHKSRKAPSRQLAEKRPSRGSALHSGDTGETGSKPGSPHSDDAHPVPSWISCNTPLMAGRTSTNRFWLSC